MSDERRRQGLGIEGLWKKSAQLSAVSNQQRQKRTAKLKAES